MQAPDSIFSQAFPLSAKIATSPDRRGFIKTLQSYISQTPIILPVQLDDSYKSLSTFVTRVENELGYYEHKSAQSLLGDQERQLRELYEQKLANQRKSEGELRQQLQRLQLDYFSLQSQLQLQKSTEPNHVAQTLENLNRTISDIGSSLSAHLTGDYILATFGKDPSDISALRAVDLPELKTLLGHVDGKSSLISSSDGHGMPIERFFDYSIRSMICHYLVKSIFEPFHPGISSSLSQSLLATYKKLQKQGEMIIIIDGRFADRGI
ncbi:hypothetical protein FRC11_012916 [Ceratobasidium sp. 423]|nr:hypothetical protein FRC11_012916 [Ceratobasidium sp. 423]